MKSKALQIFCWLALGVTALGAFFVASSGTFYSTGAEDEVPLQFLTMIVSGAVGLIISGLMVYKLIVRPEEWLVYVPALLLGVGLLALAFEPAWRRSE